MKNWKYIEGAKTGNGLLDILKSEKPIKMKSSKGAIVTIHPDGSAAHQDKEGSQMAVHHYNSFKEAVEYYKNQGYEKVGNDTPWEYAHRKPKVINEDKTGAEEFFKQLSDDVKEREKKDDADIEKVGNANLETSVEKGKLGLWNWYVHKDGTIVSGGTSSTEANAKEMARKALEKEKAGNKVGNAKDKNGKELRVGDIVLVWTSAGERAGKVKAISGDRITVAIRNEGDWSTPGKLADKVSNSKVGNATPNYRYKDFLITNPEGHEYIVFLKDGRTVGYRGTTSKAQAEDWCDWHDPKTGKSIGNKVGNRVIEKESEMSQELKTLLKKAPEWIKEKIQYAFSHGFTIDEKDFITAIKKEVGNKKLKFTDKKDGLKEFVYDEENDKGYIYYDGKLVDTIPNAGQGWLNLIKQKAFSSGVMNKTGNLSSDDKFAYVMREFDEGKLKTPDGKVVTDPAQAKAIAYSESKKTENGLARARKAMNSWNSERKIEPVGKYKEFIDNLKNAIELGTAGVLYNSLDEQTVKEWVEKAKKEGYGSHISGVQGKKVILK